MAIKQVLASGALIFGLNHCLITTAQTVQSTVCGNHHQVAFVEAPNCGTSMCLVFEDNFDGAEVNLAKWEIRTGLLRNPNDELQCYSADNVSVSGGSLHLIATATPIDDCYDNASGNGGFVSRNFKSGEVDTRFRYGMGYYEARVKLPDLGLVSAGNFWPAFWIYGEEAWQPDVHQTEIDIFEFWWSEGCKIHMTTHVGDRCDGCFSDVTHCAAPQWIDNYCYDGNWKTFGLYWDEYNVIWYYEGQPLRNTPRYTTVNGQLIDCASIQTYTPYRRVYAHTYPLHPGNIILNLATRYNELFSANSEAYPDEMEVDYVRYYRNEGCSGGLVIENAQEFELGLEYNFKRGEWFEIGGGAALTYGQQFEVAASESIVLTPGFRAEPWSTFVGRIDPGICGASNGMAPQPTMILSEFPTDRGLEAKYAMQTGQSMTTLAPNPAGSSFTISGLFEFSSEQESIVVGNAQSALMLEVQDAVGSSVMSKEVAASKIEVDVSTLADGLYTVHIWNRGAILYTTKVMVVH